MTLILFTLKRNVKVLFQTVNKELYYVNEWFIANKLSVNAGKTKFIPFYKQSARESISLSLPFENFQ